jgi:hypothetical protein
MPTTEPPTPPYGPGDAPLRESPRSTMFGDVLDDIVPVIEVIPVYGPPLIFVLGPWLLLGLMLSGPFAVLVAFAAVAAAVVVLFAALAGILATPFLIVRALRRRYRTAHPIAAPAGRVAQLESPRVLA